jgi:colicin import membrane protein
MELLDAEKSVVAEYRPFYAQMAQIEKDNASIVFDYESKKGNKEARSHVHSLRLTKGALDRTRKSAKEESLRIGRAIDSEAKSMERRFDAMIAIHQAKLDEIEKREQDRVAALIARMATINAFGMDATTADDIRQAIAALEAVAIDDTWQEFAADAARAKDSHLQDMRACLIERQQHEAVQAELDRLRIEAAARAQQERDEAIAKAATERANAEAAALAKREAEKARKAIDDAEAKAKQERADAERRELELKLQAENAERRRVEAEQRAEQDKQEAAAKAEADKQKAIQAEKDRTAAAVAAEADAKAKREKDKAHRATINRAALDALIAGGISEDCAKACVTLIVQGKVPAIQISY